MAARIVAPTGGRTPGAATGHRLRHRLRPGCVGRPASAGPLTAGAAYPCGAFVTTGARPRPAPGRHALAHGGRVRDVLCAPERVVGRV